MQKLFIIASVCLALTLALPYDLIQDEQGQHYYLVPASRVRRDTDWNLNKNPGKVHVTHSGTIYNDGDHSVDGKVYGTKSFIDPHDPAIVGGKLNYNHNSGSGLSLQAVHKERAGTKVGAEGTYNLYRNGPFHLDLTGDYSRTYGEGRVRTTHPSWNTNLMGTVDF